VVCSCLVYSLFCLYFHCFVLKVSIILYTTDTCCKIRYIGIMSHQLRLYPGTRAVLWIDLNENVIIERCLLRSWLNRYSVTLSITDISAETSIETEGRGLIKEC
jgi:hypothetical protein